MTAQEQSNYSARKGDVFFTRTSETVEEIGISAVLLDDLESGVFSGFVLRGRPISNQIIPEFSKYCYATHSVRKQVVSTASYTTRALTNGKLLSRVKTIIPSSKEEQKQISIWITESEILIKSIENLISKKRDIKQSTMQELLTGKTRLPGFTGEWTHKTLGEIGTFMKGRGVSVKESQTGDIPCIRYGEIYTLHHDVISKFYSHISEEVAATSIMLKSGDILFTGSGETREEIGKCVAFVNEFEAYAGGDIVILQPRNMNSEFLGYYLNSEPIRKQKASLGQGDAVVHIYSKQLSSILIHVPVIEEQKAIAETLSDMDAEIVALEQRLEKTKAIREGMMQQLLTGRIRLVDPGTPVEASA